MAASTGSGCAGWVVAGILAIVLIGRCSQDSEKQSPTSLADLSRSTPLHQRYLSVASLNCRAAGSANAEIVEKLAGDDRLDVLQLEGGWSQIDRATPCWVKSSYLSTSPRPAEPQRFVSEAFSAPARVARFSGRSFANCSEARAAGAAPVYASDPGYSRRLDRDGDGVGCE